VAKTFKCTVVTPQQQLLSLDVAYADVPLWDGQLGILPGRAPILARLGTGVLNLETEGGYTRVFIGGGFAQMKGEQLTILAEEAMTADQIDKAAAAAELREAETPSNGSSADMEDHKRKAARARGMLAATA
jgi:F-type H+-transporting ATPase subunit epsilon